MRRLVVGSRSAVVCWLAGFAVLQLGLALVLERWQEHLRDPEYGYKRELLERRLAEEPDRPLLLALGSSRVLNGLSPEVLPAWRTADGREPLVFNFGLTAHLSVHQLVVLRRLLAEDIRPRWAVVEVVPGRLNTDRPEREVFLEKQTWRDLRVLDRYWPDRPALYAHWLETRVVPWFSFRYCLLNHWKPTWLPLDRRGGEYFFKVLDRSGWVPVLALPPQGLAHALTQEKGLLGLQFAGYRVTPYAEQSLRELLALCRQEDITPVLAILPEHTVTRQFYDPAVESRLQAFLAALARDHGVPVIDARAWVPDEHFRDGQHLQPGGAELFTRRFGAEVLEPLVQGTLPRPGPVQLATGGPGGP